MFKTTKGLILRETKYREADKILTVLTEDEGKLTVSARGVMRGSSRIAAACQLLTFSEMTLFENRGKWYVGEALSIEQFLGLRSGIAPLALGTYFAELLEAVSDEDSPNPEVLRLGLNSLFALSQGRYPPEHIKAVFELRLMCLSGYEPALGACPVCGSGSPEAPVFSVAGGTALCGACRGGEYGGAYPLDGAALSAMRHIAGAESRKIFSFTLDGTSAELLCACCEAYVRAQLERRFAALDYWKNVQDS
ncbi:MAG: DNA repair protein RecO [Oscillospiraceae bacterium]|nr:DNA repair protein RecO [Oscillospiraceae bacterium]